MPWPCAVPVAVQVLSWQAQAAQQGTGARHSAPRARIRRHAPWHGSAVAPSTHTSSAAGRPGSPFRPRGTDSVPCARAWRCRCCTRRACLRPRTWSSRLAWLVVAMPQAWQKNCRRRTGPGHWHVGQHEHQQARQATGSSAKTSCQGGRGTEEASDAGTRNSTCLADNPVTLILAAMQCGTSGTSHSSAHLHHDDRWVVRVQAWYLHSHRAIGRGQAPRRLWREGPRLLQVRRTGRAWQHRSC